MKKKIRIGNTKVVTTIDQSQYIGGGGEAGIYVQGNVAYKLYHNPAAKMLPLQKIQELSAILDPQVVKPQDIIYDEKTGQPLGYTTQFISGADPILKLFNRAYKVTNNVDPQMVADLVRWMQNTMISVHSAKCLVVDFNELNILIRLGNSSIAPWFIDTDSYSTPSFKATAIMDSIRDRQATVYDAGGKMHYNPTVLTDWFSWAVISFWVYTNLHPYRGSHPKYKPKDKLKQMDDNISVFHPGVRVPPTVEDFGVIPKRHLDWFKLVFEKGDRSIPPFADSSVPILVPTQIITITGTDKLMVQQIASCSAPILSVQQILGVNYIVTKDAIYIGNNKVGSNDPSKKVVFCVSNGGMAIVSTRKGHTVEFTEAYTGNKIETIQSTDIFERNNAVYTITNGKLTENTFTMIGTKLVHRIKTVENVSNLSAKMYDGCVVQDLLGKKYLTIPYALGKSFSKYLPGLDGVRIIDAKSDKNVTVIIGEEGGKYNRYVVVFDKKYQSFEMRSDADIPYEPINFAVLDNGLCLLLSAADQIQLFSTANQYETLDDPPFDASMPLFATAKGFFFVNGSSIHQLKRK